MSNLCDHKTKDIACASIMQEAEVLTPIYSMHIRLFKLTGISEELRLLLKCLCNPLKTKSGYCRLCPMPGKTDPLMVSVPGEALKYPWCGKTVY